MSVRYSTRARNDLAHIVEYLEQRSPQAARSVRQAIEKGTGILADFPLLAPVTVLSDVREMTIVRYPYKVYYTVQDGNVVIVHIRDARRRPWIDELRD